MRDALKVIAVIILYPLGFIAAAFALMAVAWVIAAIGGGS